MSYAHKVEGVWIEVAGGFEAGGVQYPANWPELATDEEREALGVFPIADAGPEPVGVKVLGQALVGASTPSRIWVTEPYSLAEAKAAALAKLRAHRAAKVSDPPLDADPSAYVSACYAHAAMLATAVNGAGSAAAVAAINLEAGWPE